MTIYHYTSIQTLALILKHKKIRFNRLDRVDDLEESIYGSGPTNSYLSQYTFVSCWTRNEEENLALWNMYTRYKGVRIGLDEMPFRTYKVNNQFYSYFDTPIGIKDDYIYSYIQNEAKLQDVVYVDNPDERIKNLIKPTGTNGIYLNTRDVGIYKRKEWAMQQESRFKIYLMPVNLVQAFGNLKNEGNILFNALSTLFDSIGSSIIHSEPIKTEHIDIDLDTDKLNGIEIMMGPLTTEADRIIVESLMQPFNGAIIKNSFFHGKLKEKST